MVWFMAALTFVGGALNAIQTGCNAQLNRVVGQPLVSGIMIAGVNILAYVVLAPFLGLHVPEPKAVAQVPWWAWLGGACGAGSILCTILFSERLGSGIFTGLVVTASIVTSVALDHFGLLGFAERPATLWRVVGCLVMLLGLSMVAAF